MAYYKGAVILNNSVTYFGGTVGTRACNQTKRMWGLNPVHMLIFVAVYAVTPSRGHI